MYKYSKIRRYNSDVHVFEFDSNEFRLDATIGIRGKLERLSKINGEPKPDEYTIAKINGGFFFMNGASEYIGTFVDEGLYYNGASKYYPTLVYWKKDNKLSFEFSPDTPRHAYYQKNAHFAVGIPWTLVKDGKIDYTFTRKELIDNFGHPYQRHPRTMLGQRANGDVVMVVVDGRRATSVGVDIIQSSKLMLELRCIIAGNLDGGGSSEMIVNDKIVNTPSDGGRERAMGTAFMVYAKRNNTTENNSPQRRATTTAGTLNVRTGPGTNYSTCGSLSRGSTIYVISSNNGWAKIVYGNSVAYVSTGYIKYV